MEVKKLTRSEEAAYVQLIVGVFAIVCLFVPWSFFAATAFRPDRPPEVLHAMYDLAWLPLYMFSTIFAFRGVFLGWAMRADKRVKPRFPRWFSHYTAFAGVVQAFGVIVILEKSGPLAWNGVIAYWIPLVIFGIWTNLMVKYMMNGVKEDAAEAELQADPAPAGRRGLEELGVGTCRGAAVARVGDLGTANDSRGSRLLTQGSRLVGRSG